MSRSIVLALLFLGLEGTSAFAIDLTIKSSLSQTVEANDNYFLLPAPKPIFRPLTTLTLDAVGQSPTTKFTLNGDIGYFKYLGPGADNMATTSGTQGGVRFGVVKSGKAAEDKTSFFTSWRTQDLVSAQLADTGVPTGSGQVTTTSVGGGLSRQLSLRDTLSWFATGTFVEYTSQGTAPYTNMDHIATWKHRVNATNDITSFADFSWTWRDDQTQSETKFLRLMTGWKSAVTRRLDFTAHVGVGFVNGSQGNPGGAVVTSTSGISYPVFSGTGSAQGLLWDALALYRIDPTTRVSLSAAQTIAPDINGNLSQRKTAGVGFHRDVNSRSSVDLSGQFTRYSAPGSQITSSSSYDYFSATAAYNYRLAREWRSSVAYTYRQRNSQGLSVDSNGLMVTIAHDATLLPHLP